MLRKREKEKERALVLLLAYLVCEFLFGSCMNKLGRCSMEKAEEREEEKQRSFIWVENVKKKKPFGGSICDQSKKWGWQQCASFPFSPFFIKTQSSSPSLLLWQAWFLFHFSVLERERERIISKYKS